MAELLSQRHTYFFPGDEEELDLDKRKQIEIPPNYQRIGGGNHEMQHGDLIFHRHSPLPNLNFSMYQGDAELAEVADDKVMQASISNPGSYTLVLRPVPPGSPAIAEKALCDRCQARVRDEEHEWRYCGPCGMHISDEERSKRT